MFLLPYISMPLQVTHRWLLDNGFTRTISRYMDPGVLLDGAQILVIAIAIVVSVIYLYLFNKKRLFFYTSRIRKHLENWISEVIMEDEEASAAISLRIQRVLTNDTARQFMIDELIQCKRNFSGSVSGTIVSLYEQLGLKAFSLRKLKSHHWHIKAKGIQELYLMDQKTTLRIIYKNTNSKNEFVRMEAQTGVINLTGFSGLRFLDVVSYPITEWQQIKLLEQLRLHPDKEDISAKIPKWLQSKNNSVVVFALKLADEYQVFAVREHVIKCLLHPEKSIRSQAIKTTIRLADEHTPGILLKYFSNESLQDQVVILDALRSVATEEETPFLLTLLDHPNDTIKLKTAAVLAATSEKGMAILENRAKEMPEPFERICHHVKSVK